MYILEHPARLAIRKIHQCCRLVRVARNLRDQRNEAVRAVRYWRDRAFAAEVERAEYARQLGRWGNEVA